jgi:hypothetical protein
LVGNLLAVVPVYYSANGATLGDEYRHNHAVHGDRLFEGQELIVWERREIDDRFIAGLLGS